MGIIRKTKSVRLLLDVFHNTRKAISVVELVADMSKYMNKTTVYRILDRLEQEGMVHSFLGKEGLKWYAKCADCTSHHHSDLHPHFQCNDCGTIECLPIDIKIPAISDRQVSSVDIIMTGKCVDCLA